jgi:hypothetical protein
MKLAARGPFRRRRERRRRDRPEGLNRTYVDDGALGFL